MEHWAKMGSFQCFSVFCNKCWRILGNIKIKRNRFKWFISPCPAIGLFLYPLKTSENQNFSVFRGYRKRTGTWNELKIRPKGSVTTECDCLKSSLTIGCHKTCDIIRSLSSLCLMFLSIHYFYNRWKRIWRIPHTHNST